MSTLQLHKGRALVVVAHPDDETIWMGGTILVHPDLEWTIFALCRGDDPDRAPKFRSVTTRYGAEGFISDLEDEGRMTIRASIPEIERRLVREMQRRNYDYIFTHAPNGEYGHPRHKGVSRAVRNLLKRGALRANEILFFAYRLNEARRCAIPRDGAHFQTPLSDAVWREKQRIIRNLYGFSEDSFEFRSASRVENFL